MELQEILDHAHQLAVSANKKLSPKKDDDICLHDLYKPSVEMVESISYHAVKGVFPKKLFKHRSPNETKAESDYIEANYKQLTLPVFVDYISTICRPMGEGNWSIDYKEDSAEYKQANKTFQQYVENELPNFGSLENYVKSILPSIKTIDANGFLAVRPAEIKYKDNEDNTRSVDSSELYSPTIFYFESKAVVDYKSTEYYLFLSDEKSKVRYNTKDEWTGSIYELYTKDAVFLIIQEGAKIDNKFRVEEFYRHDLGSCQVHQLMGIPHLKDGKILWQSPFLYATDLLDLVATNGNWEQAMINSCVFPVKVMFGSTCEFKDSEQRSCQGGTISVEGVDTTCPSCNGQGLKSRLSPIGTMLVKPPTKFEEGDYKSIIDPLKYISPETHTLEFIHKKVESDTLKARAILKLRNRNTTVQTSDGTITATEVVDDAKGMYAFIKPISDQIFTLYEFLLKSIGQQRYGEKFVAPALSYPKTFDFKSAEDYLIDIKNANENGLPPSFVKIILMQYINAFYGDSEMVNRIFKLIDSADKLFGLSQDEINMKLAKGTASKWQDILHYSILNFINDSVREDDKFMDKKIEDQILVLEEKAKKMQLEIEGKPEGSLLTDLLPDTGGGNQLASSVGGLTGMIEIVKAVASGVYDLEAAVSLVSQRFGITEEEARKQLGTPTILTNENQIDKVVALT